MNNLVTWKGWGRIHREMMNSGENELCLRVAEGTGLTCEYLK